MMSFRSLGAGYMVPAALVSLALALVSAVPALAAPQYSMTCDYCHRMPPLDATSGSREKGTGSVMGNHQGHAGNDAASCARCHGDQVLSYGTSHRNRAIEMRENINDSPLAATYQRAFFNQTSVPPRPLGSCSSVNCHFEAATPTWGSAPFTSPNDCSQCHSAAPSSGNHPGVATKHGIYYGTGTGACQKCHPDHAAEARPFLHATSAATRGIAVRFTSAPNNGGSYSGDGRNFLPSQGKTSYGSCRNLYCHSDGKGGAPLTTPTWGGSFATPCISCHDGGGAATRLSGVHGGHTDASAKAAITCERCHLGTASGSGAIKDRTRHVNGVKDVAFQEGGSFDPAGKGCNATYCHSNAAGGPPNQPVTWNDTGKATCYSCHNGRTVDNTAENCAAVGGTWLIDANQNAGYCTPYLNMTSNGHSKLVGPRWIRKYPCTYCHTATVSGETDASGKIVDGQMVAANHVNGVKDVAMHPQWAITGRDAPSYNPADKTCDNVYCHSDGTTNPDAVKKIPWSQRGTECNSCHGHPRGSCSASDPVNGIQCHDGQTDKKGNVWVLPPTYGNLSSYHWPTGQEWKAAIPMFPNQGAGTARANSHMRHVETNFTCDICHAATIRSAPGTSTGCVGVSCHSDGQPIPAGAMSEVSHLNGDKHVNKSKDVAFQPYSTKNGKVIASYNSVTKTCTNVSCHNGGPDPQWGGSVNSAVICLNCHGTGSDVDSFGFRNFSTQAKISMTSWVTTGHGRPASAGPYPVSGNPAANFPGNPCWYCHDNTVIHNDGGNPFRLRQHQQFSKRFDKECIYCHMTGTDAECRGCHNNSESLAPQLSTLRALPSASWPDGTPAPRPDHTVMTGAGQTCISAQCHALSSTSDLKVHNAGAGLWSSVQQADVRNQYIQMGVCLKCHDDDTGGKCTSCHQQDPANPFKYSLGFDPGTGFIKPQKARASSSHFGYKHNREYLKDGVWRGGKFCWDCHDPHGDGNIYMIHDQVATTTDGTFGVPKTRAAVVFTKKSSGLDYARISAPYNGICNVCHAGQAAQLSKHYGNDYGDGHNASRVCTTCHEHRFTDSHADDQPCNSCHNNKPVPRHSAFGQPRDCTKCHSGTIGLRMDVMGQMNANSHHVQGVQVKNTHCYACHWESTPEGLIDTRYHEGYNYKTYTSVKNAKVDLVVWKPGVRPTFYNSTTATQFLAKNIGTSQERAEAAKVSASCIGCHSDGNNDSKPFNDCKTPRQYAWDGQSVAARYSQTGTTTWGKYNSGTYPNANQKDKVVKAFSAHGNAAANQGGYDAVNGLDGAIPNTRGGGAAVQCYDCHSSHGSKVSGVTTSYVSFNGTTNGGNLKETQAGKGGYSMTYKASANTSANSMNPYNAGAGQCFDCHLTQSSGTTPWGYQSTFGASQPVKGYFDSSAFGTGAAAVQQRLPFKAGKPMVGGHMKASTFLNHSTAAGNKINGLCTPCHDPHGVSPTLGSKQAYAVPLLKGTWLTSPYKEDIPEANTQNPPYGQQGYTPLQGVHTDQSTFNNARISEDDSKFGGLCLRCHYKQNLTNGTNHAWKSQDRVHESVKGWKTANGTLQHSYSCSKCHTPHTSGLPRLMITNCLDYKHRGKVKSGGQAGSGSGLFPYTTGDYSGSFPKGIGQYGVNCHPNGSWPDNSWNAVTPW